MEEKNWVMLSLRCEPLGEVMITRNVGVKLPIPSQRTGQDAGGSRCKASREGAAQDTHVGGSPRASQGNYARVGTDMGRGSWLLLLLFSPTAAGARGWLDLRCVPRGGERVLKIQAVVVRTRGGDSWSKELNW